jgi:hypothetical protein
MNTNIAMGGVQQVDPMGAFTKVMQLRNMAAQNQVNDLALQQHQRESTQNQTLADLYRDAINPDGTIDREKVIRGAAGQGLGAKIPGLQKSFLESDEAAEKLKHTQAQTAQSKATTGKSLQETLHGAMKAADSAMAVLAADPQLNEQKVYSEVGRLVKMGVFDPIASQKGADPDSAAREFLSTMPVGNPKSLRTWVIQSGLRAADESKRLELILPKYDEQDRGGVINQGTINQMTGERTAGGDVTKTVTPGEVLTSETSRRGQNMTDTRQRQLNEITREAAQSQVVETPQGFAVINKGAADARPVRMDSGQPVLPKDSAAAKNAAMAANMTGVLPYARSLLKSGPTSSGIGAMADKLATQTGIELKSKDTAGQLETLAGWLTSNVPRFEGPQGVQDVLVYQQMAGNIGDRTKSISERLKALDTVEQLMQRYSGVPGTAPATPIPPRPAVPVRGTPAAPRGSSPMRTPAPAAAPAGPPPIDSFFK